MQRFEGYLPTATNMDDIKRESSLKLGTSTVVTGAQWAEPQWGLNADHCLLARTGPHQSDTNTVSHKKHCGLL